MAQATQHQHFSIEGMRCARCIYAIESALQHEPNVTEARVNMSTNRLALSWTGDQSLIDHFTALIESLGYKAKPFEEPKRDHSEDRFLLRCMAVAGFAMGNIMLLSTALWSSEQAVMGLATRDLLHWLSALIALPTLYYAGRPFFSSAYSVLCQGRTNMDVPISLALVLATGMSLFETFNHGEHAYFDSAVMLLFFLLIGRWLDARARGKVRENAENLLVMMQGTASVIEASAVRHLPISALEEGMVVRIAVGENIPTDAMVLTGTSDIDTSLVTGETTPRVAREGDTVYGGTLNLSAPLTARVIKGSEDSLLADIIRLMEQAEQGRAQYVRLADKAAKLYTPVVHTLAACAFIGWYAFGGMAWQEALLIAITTLIITCPCALGLAVPAVQVLATGWLMKRGIMVKSGDALERLATIDSIVFDKTGTLTLGKATLVGCYTEEHLRIAASLAVHSKHPYSQAIADAFDGQLAPIDDVQETAGKGIEGTMNGEHYFLGKGEQSGVTLQRDCETLCHFRIEDALREDSAEVVAAFADERRTCYLFSGDKPGTVKSVAHHLDIPNWYGDMLPQDKTHRIQALQSQNHQVLMVGDGLNDAPSLAQADVSMSPASGMDITQNSADIVFRGHKLAPVIQAWHMACFSTKLVKQNFVLAVVYNCIAVPIALAGMVTPMIAAIAMSLSSLIVIANSFRIQLQHSSDVH